MPSSAAPPAGPRFARVGATTAGRLLALVAAAAAAGGAGDRSAPAGPRRLQAAVATTPAPTTLCASVAFSKRVINDQADSSWWVFAADVDGDGDVDALSAARNDDTVAWYENDGSESFTERVITTLADGAFSVFAIDVDGDGDVDALSASDGDDTVAWYENDGSQSFTKRVITGSAGAAYSVYAIDVDGDGDVDALSAAKDDDTVAWHANDGSESFTQRVITAAADGAAQVIAIDVDGDGDVDALSASNSDDTFAWYENDGSQSFTERVITDSADGALAVYAIDVDVDGDVDALAASNVDDVVAWYENDGSQSFTQRVIGTPDVPRTVFAVDVDGDGDVDPVSASFTGNTVSWYENDGSQSFTERVIDTAAAGPNNVFGYDVDGDGDADFLMASRTNSEVVWYENDCAPVTPAPTPRPTVSCTSVAFSERVITTLADNAFYVFAIDVDGDGDVDALSASMIDDTIAWYENDGSESFTKHVISNAADGAYTAFAIDVDGDGDVDALSASANDNKVAWYENDGSQSFTTIIITTAATTCYSVFAIDVDGDGDVDALSASGGDDTVAWYENDGAQSFVRRDVFDSAGGPRAVYAIDVDGDGDVDPLSATNTDDTIAWYENDGSQSFTERQRVITNTADFAYSVYAIDVDGNGDVDALSASDIDDKIAWYENDGSQSFTERVIIERAADGATSVFAIDVDGDGDVDPLSASYMDDKLAWYENDGSQSFTEHAITNSLGNLAPFAIDVDGDGDHAATDDDAAADGLLLRGHAAGVRDDEGNATDATGSQRGETYNEYGNARNFGPTESRDGGDALYFDGSIYVQLPDALTSGDLTGDEERTIASGHASTTGTAASSSSTGATRPTERRSGSPLETLKATTLALSGSYQTVVTIYGNTSYIDWDDWHHYCLTYDGTDIVLYFDGLAEATAAVGLDTETMYAENLTGDEERTICLWARIDDWDGGFLFEYGSDSADGASFGLAVGDAESNVTLALSGSYQTVVTIYGNTSYIDWDDWHHYCLTYDGTDLVSCSTSTPSPRRPPAVGLDTETMYGLKVGSDMTMMNKLTGAIDELYVYTSALDREAISVLYVLPDALTYEALTGDEERTICLWARIDDWDGGFLFEYGSDSADGASFGLAVGDAESNVTLALSGSYQTVVTIYGNTSYIDWGDWHHYCLTYDGTDIVLYFDGLAGDRPGVLDTETMYGLRVGADMYESNKLTGAIDELYVYTSALDREAISVLWTVVTIYGNTSYIDWGDWHHYCLTYDGTDIVLYFDGLAGRDRPASLDTETMYGLRVGADMYESNKLTGAIDELYVYTSALDREAISVLYGSVTASPTVTPAPSTYYFEGTLRAYYSFDEGNATDATGAYSGDTYKNGHARNLGPTESRDGGRSLARRSDV
ncbi:hypothetical protein SO694_00030229 [Aureococcus anophagefferens]|uniref:LamG-like jellyroll fold domain-containing protein n=1 Tax=Aureococcus anophagefferens TaxID=44056 RepID=A0ABR1FJY9_AURAN